LVSVFSSTFEVHDDFAMSRWIPMLALVTAVATIGEISLIVWAVIVHGTLG